MTLFAKGNIVCVAIAVGLITFPVIALAKGALKPQLSEPEVAYSVASTMWPLELGAHRAKIRVKASAPAVHAHLPWRLQMKGMEKRQIIVIHVASGKKVNNVVRTSVNRMACDIVFEASAGDYFVYYLPMRNYRNPNDKSAYLPYRCGADTEWLKKNKLGDKDLPKGAWSRLPTAEVIEFQARTASDSFFPMEVIASKDETKGLQAQYSQPLLIFPEDRVHTIRMRRDLPLRWVMRGPETSLAGEAQRHEYFTFQLGLFASSKKADNVSVQFSDLRNESGAVIQASALTCFNLGGIDSMGEPFTKVVHVPVGQIQALWFGVDIAKDQAVGVYAGTIDVRADHMEPQKIEVRIKVLPEVIAERGDNEPWRHSRLRWLNSTAGSSDTIPAPYQALEVEGSAVSCVGRVLKLGKGGLPASIRSGDVPVLQSPIRFTIESTAGPLSFTSGKSEWTQQTQARVAWKTDSKGTFGVLSCNGEMEYDGHVRYSMTYTPSHDMDLKDVRLELPMQPEAAQYIVGAGHDGGVRPKDFSWNWKGPYNSFWLGSTEAGLHCKLLGGSYTGPMLSLYHPKPPTTWGNRGKGGLKIIEQGRSVTATVFSGSRKLKAGVPMTFEFSLLITPLKPLDPPTHFKTRYYHTGDNWLKDGRGNDPEPSEANLALGVNVVNLHHASIFNPYINYPFIRTKELSAFTKKMHSKQVKVKVYNTVRELTSMVPELWALRSLGDEVIAPGGGGGYSWCQEHMIDGYRPAWFQRFGDSPPDAAFVTSGNPRSRWQNYYVEGNGWLVRNMDTDGIYLDDVSYDRTILQRVRAVMAEAKPGCLIDLHSNTGFSKGCVNHYMEFLPYIDRPWFGESFHYDAMTPDQYLIQVSGIPFGLMGEMLHAGGNLWRGTLYGMTNRLGWTTNRVKCDPRPVWKIWDRFGITDSKMIGYWKSDCPVKTDNDQVLATVYQKEGSAMIALASWAASPVDVRLVIDWKALGLDPAKAKFFAPASVGFQQAKQWKVGDSIKVSPKRGLLILVDESGPTEDDLAGGVKMKRSILLKKKFTAPLGKEWTTITSKQAKTSVTVSKTGGLVFRAPAHVSACVKGQLPKGTTAVECLIENKGDRGETWGPGLTLSWPGGQALRINLRTPSGAFGLESTGGVQRVGLGRMSSGPMNLRIRLEKDEVVAEATDGDGFWQQLGAYPRVDFPGEPNQVVLGKTRGVVDTSDHTDSGPVGASIIQRLVIYGK
ncbi:hypothetical protein HW115_16900 [Verrucomicrobiaceae bacterium N1E253]|uniref:Glycoside hydrolase 123-like N-terminal domain-containing protein n=1 Tax=Oceaniferula marina TaxID=2748318 RepID=A0A851GIG5_9BACT|nr:glycoside hydrolase domain-containing protein [Oceaniferula marina]NWK57303.1 hypothetical protein [Oceaniferula marina]